MKVQGGVQDYESAGGGHVQTMKVMGEGCVFKQWKCRGRACSKYESAGQGGIQTMKGQGGWVYVFKLRKCRERGLRGVGVQTMKVQACRGRRAFKL